jgi:hypothetical protein
MATTPFKMKSSPAKLFGRKKVYDPNTGETTVYNRYGEKVKTKYDKKRRRGTL